MSESKAGYQVSIKKKVIVIGWALLGVLFVGIFTVTVVAVLQGEGIKPLRLIRGGKGGSFFPIELLTVFLVVIVAGVVWIGRRFFFPKGKAPKRNRDESKG